MRSQSAAHIRVSRLNIWFSAQLVDLPMMSSWFFLISGGIGWDGRAAILPHGRFTSDELFNALELYIPAVPECRVHFSGGRRSGRNWTFQDGDVICFRYIPDVPSEPPEASESEPSSLNEYDECLDSDATGPLDFQEDGPDPSEHEPASSSGGRFGSATAKYVQDDSGDSLTILAADGSSSMWNGAVLQDALLGGTHGDTPTEELEHSGLLQHCGEHDLHFVDAQSKKYHRSCRGAPLPGFKWGLVGLILYSQCVNAAGVVHKDAEQRVSLPILDDSGLLHASFDSQSSCSHVPKSADWIHCSALQGQADLEPVFANGTGSQFPQDVIITALEEGKGAAFHTTCAELCWFFSWIKDKTGMTNSFCESDGPACGPAAGYIHVDGKIPLNLHDALQLCDNEQPPGSSRPAKVELPDDWLLPEVLFLPWPDFDLTSNVSGWNLHEASVIALHLSDPHSCWTNNQWDLHLYTDGSAKDNTAGWAVVIVASSPDTGRCSFLGRFGGKLGDMDDLGSSAAVALQAEQTALRWACLWILPQLHGLGASFNRVFFCWDCLAAGLGASGDCCLADTPLAGPLRGLFFIGSETRRATFSGQAC